MRAAVIHPAHCACAACRPLLPPERAHARARRRLFLTGLALAAGFALLLL